MEQLQRIFNDLKDSNEIAIIERYGRNAKCYTATLTSNSIFQLFLLFIFNKFVVGNFFTEQFL